jgi:DNA-binding LytR/AlgR family response regulator
MKTNKRNVLLISPDKSSTAYLAQVLEGSGGYAVKTATTGRAAVGIHKKTAIDLAFCDVKLKGSWSSVETVRQLLMLSPVSIIYLTESGTELETFPTTASQVTYLHKPVRFDDLFHTIEVVAGDLDERLKLSTATQEGLETSEGSIFKKSRFKQEAIFRIDDSIFIKSNYQFIKVLLADIVLLEASNTYVSLITVNRKFVLRQTLSSLLERLHLDTLVRVHRSFAVNIRRVDLFSEHEISIEQHKVPLGRHFRQQFIDRFQCL